MRKELNYLKEQHKHVKAVEEDLKEDLIKKYPNIEDIYFTDSSFNIRTKHHTIYVSKFTGMGPKPDMRNCGQDMPSTPEGMMKKMMEIKNDSDKIRTAAYYVAFRYPIFDYDV